MYGKSVTNKKANSMTGTAIATIKQASLPLPKCIISCPRCPGSRGSSLNINTVKLCIQINYCMLSALFHDNVL